MSAVGPVLQPVEGLTKLKLSFQLDAERFSMVSAAVHDLVVVDLRELGVLLAGIVGRSRTASKPHLHRGGRQDIDRIGHPTILAARH